MAVATTRGKPEQKTLRKENIIIIVRSSNPPQ